jgi:hypothetical protein
MRFFSLLAIVLSGAVLGDAGYLGSAVQGPVPVPGSGTAVRMLAEDVLIQIDLSSYSLTGDFLFFSPENEGTAYMYFPVDVITPFLSALYSAMQPLDLLRSISVSVNGEAVDVFPLFVGQWNPDSVSNPTWETVQELMLPLYPEEPVSGQPLYLTRMPSYAVLTGSEDALDSMCPAIDCQAVNAAWMVEFGESDTILVEYSVSGRMTVDYEATMATLCYPLQTGSTWSGAIGRGRITVVPGEMEQIAFATGVMMPPGEMKTQFVFEPLQELANCSDFEETRLSDLSGSSFNGGIVWNFCDFKPTLSPTGWRAFYPGLGDMYGVVADSVVQWTNGESGLKPAGWTGSYIYVCLSDQKPVGFTVISIDGLPLRDSPSGDARQIVNLPVTSWLDVLEWRNNWVLVETELSGYPSGDAGRYTGWIQLNSAGEDGLVIPSALPML